VIEGWHYSLAGAGVGAVVGMTGIGGGALMTPILVMLFGVSPHSAVGTDLLFASVTKMFGVGVHGRHGTVDWLVVRRLATGSLPLAAITALLLSTSGSQGVGAGFILHALGVALVLTAVGLVLKKQLHRIGRRLRINAPERFKGLQPALTVAAGAVLGVLVALTSVGAGALGTVMLVYLYPFRMTPSKLVGTDLAHALPLAMVAGTGHLLIGNVDFALLGWLLLGSIPGILLGATFSARAPEAFIRPAIAVVLGVVGLRLLV